MYIRIALYMSGRPLKHSMQIIVGEAITMAMWLVQGLVIDASQRGAWIWINLGCYFLIWQVPEALYLYFYGQKDNEQYHEIPLVPVDAAHVIERLGCFVVIFLGEVVDDITEVRCLSCPGHHVCTSLNNVVACCSIAGQ